ncbi:MAG TPA: ATPase, partial [Candidatus Brachybacterium merdavium]|nr:ATPase [Candidatus Brachybacterium merdavium]
GAAAGGNPADGPLSLAEFLRSRIFADLDLTTLAPDPAGAEGYATWLRHYRTGLQVERLAGEVLD